MKKILFNGCSFVAGDALVWEEYINEINRLDFTWDKVLNETRTPESHEIVEKYRYEYRRNKNLPAILAKKLNTEVIDISEDGNSNDAIALTTILSLLSMPKEVRKNYHVIIGWSIAPRALKYSKEEKAYYNLNVHFEQKFGKNIPTFDELENYIKHAIINVYDEDHFLNYIKNIMLVENFLKENECTYTFYRSLGSKFDWINHNLFPIHKKITTLTEPVDKKLLSNDDCWFKFSEFKSKMLGFEGASLCSEYIDGPQYKNQISKSNIHPNLKVVNEVADRLFNFIKEKNLGF